MKTAEQERAELELLELELEMRKRGSLPVGLPDAMVAAGGVAPVTAMMSGAGVAGQLGQEAMRQYVGPAMRSGGISAVKTPEQIAATEELVKNLTPSVSNFFRYAPLLVPNPASAGRAVLQNYMTGTTGETVARFIEGNEQDMGEAGQSGALQATGSVFKTFAPSGSFLGRGAQFLGSAATNAAVQAGGAAAAEALRSISSGEGLPSGQQLVSAAKLPAIVGFSFGGVGQAGRSMGTLLSERTMARRAFGSERLPPGIESPTIMGRSAGAVEAAGGDIGIPALEARINANFRSMFGPTKDGAEVVRFLSPYVGQLDEASARLAALSDDSLRAEDAYQQAQAAYQQAVLAKTSSTDERIISARLRLDDAAARARGVRAKAIADNAYKIQQARLSNEFVSPAEMRNVFVQRVMNPLRDVVNRQVDELYSRLPFSRTEEVFDSGALLSDLRQTLKDEGRDAAGEFESRFLAALRPSRADDGTLVYPRKSLQDIRKLRRDMWSAYTDPQPGGPRADAAMIAKVDKALGGSLRKQMEAVFDADTVKLYDEANAFYSAQSDAMSSPAARALFVADPKDGAFRDFVNDLVDKGGASDAYKGLIRYIDTVAVGAPAVQQAAKSHVMDLVRAGIVERNFGSAASQVSDSVDVLGVLKDVRRLAQDRFPVEQLGLGSVTQLEQIARLANGAGLGSRLSADELQELVGNPLVREAMRSPNKAELPRVGTLVAKELAAYRDLRLERLQRIAGLTKQAEVTLARAQKRLGEAGVDVADAQARLGSMQNDPLYLAFQGNKNFGLTGKGQDDFGRFIRAINNTDMTTAQEVKDLLAAIAKKSPEMREQIALQTLTDTIKALSTNQATGARGINWDELGKFLDPQNPARGNLAKERLRIIVGDDAFNELRRFMPRLEIMRRFNTRAAAFSPSRTAVGEAAGATASGVGAGTAGSTSINIRYLDSLLSRGHYKGMALLMANPAFRSATKGGAKLGEILAKTGLQRTYNLLTNNPDLQATLNDEQQPRQ